MIMINSLKTFANFFMTTISLMTAFGVFMHDGRIDKAALTSVRYYEKPVLLSQSTVGARFRDFVATDAHTHPDHNAAKNSLMSSFSYQSPSIPPRESQHRRHLMQLMEPRGRHAFDNTNLPILA